MEGSLVLWTIVIGSVFVVLLKLKTAHDAYNGALSEVPGPWDTKFSNVREKLGTLSGSWPRYLFALHQSYGPLVRISPTTVSTSDAEASKTIYNLRTGYDKTSWYSKFIPSERPLLFTRISREEHTARKRILIRGFQTGFLRTHCEPSIFEVLSFTIQKMRESATQDGGVVDIFKWWMLAMADVAGVALFGESFGEVEAGEETEYIRYCHKMLMGCGIAAEMPFLRTIAPYVPIKGFRELFDPRAILAKYEQRAVENAKSTTKQTIFTRPLQHLEKGDPMFNDLDVAIEATNFTTAGSDTSGITITYLIWAVLRQANTTQGALEAEVCALAPSELTDAKLEQLPVLNAVLQEALRLYSAAPGPFPRAIPPEGAVICGYALPPGTTIYAPTWTLHRRQELWGDDADDFDHTRWLPQNVAKRVSEDARTAFSPWGGARHECIGKNMASMSMRLGTALFFREFRGAKISSGMKETDMDILNIFMNKPRGERCLIEVPR